MNIHNGCSINKKQNHKIQYGNKRCKTCKHSQIRLREVLCISKELISLDRERN